MGRAQRLWGKSAKAKQTVKKSPGAGTGFVRNCGDGVSGELGRAWVPARLLLPQSLVQAAFSAMSRYISDPRSPWKTSPHLAVEVGLASASSS